MARIPRTALAPTAALAAALAACGVGAGPADLAVDGGRDLPAEVLDVPGADDAGPEAGADEGGTDTPPTCRSILLPGQCLEAGDCPGWQDCSGTAGCYEPPCWGEWCPDLPGACLSATSGTACPGLTGCPAGYGCAGITDGGQGACRALPAVAGACWEDGDCKGQTRCSGEVRCDPERITACAEHPGLCLPPPPAGRCLDDEDCTAGSWCRGAQLCRVDDAFCADILGTCEAGERPSCSGVEDCTSSPDGRLCVGAGPGGVPRGWCAEGPVLHAGDCWDDAYCNDLSLGCSGSLPCPPGRRCRAGGQRAGFCMPFPATTPGVEEPIAMTYAGDATGDPEGVAVVRNRLPTAIVVASCYTVAVETAMDGRWPDPPVLTGYMHDALCPADPTAPEVLVRIPAGGTRTLRGLVNSGTEGAYRRFVLTYRMGCDGLPSTSPCRVTNRTAFSAAFR